MPSCGNPIFMMMTQPRPTPGSVSDEQPTNVKIAYLGGGSRYWARDLMEDLAVKAPFSGEIVLYDINHAAAEKNVAIGEAIFARPEANSRFAVRAVTTLADCLKGADFVVISIEPGPMELRHADLEIPLRYGIYQPVGDTVGPGGLLRALRCLPTFEQFAEAIMEYCPAAWVINYTNPMSLCTQVLYAVAPGIKAFGCCHEVFGSQQKLVRLVEAAYGAEVKRQDIRVEVSGVNHFTWITGARWQGQDILPLYREKAGDPASYRDATDASLERVKTGNYFSSEGLVAMDLTRRFGAMAAAGDRHLVEFVPWYVQDEATLHRWGVVMTPFAFRMERWQQPDQSADLYAQNTINPSKEEGVEQMAALLGLGDLDTNVNLPNRGQAPDLPLGAVVETNAAFREGTLTPLVTAPLPLAVQAMTRQTIAQQQLTLQAVRERDLDLALQALLIDPLVTGEMDAMARMFREMVTDIWPHLQPHYPALT